MAPNLLQRKCRVCSENHPIRLRSNFSRMTFSARLATVKKHKCCTNCLAASHEFRRCQSGNVCYICKRKHHSLIHRILSSPGRNRGEELTPLTLLILIVLRKSLLLYKSEMKWIMIYLHPLLLDLFKISLSDYCPPRTRQIFRNYACERSA